MAGEVLLLWPHIDHRDVALSHAPAQLLDAHRLQLVASVDVEICNLFDFGQSTPSERFEVPHKPKDVVSRETIINEGAATPGLHEPCLAQHAEVCARVFHRRCRLVGELLDRFLALTEEVEQLDALGARNGVANASELLVQRVLEVAMRHYRGCWRLLTNSTNR